MWVHVSHSFITKIDYILQNICVCGFCMSKKLIQNVLLFIIIYELPQKTVTSSFLTTFLLTQREETHKNNTKNRCTHTISSSSFIIQHVKILFHCYQRLPRIETSKLGGWLALEMSRLKKKIKCLANHM